MAGSSDISEELPDPILAQLTELGGKLDGVAARLAAVAGRERRTRQLAWALGFSFFLDIALTVVVAILTVSAVSQGSSTHQSQLATCAISNQTRADERELWSYLFQLSGGQEAKSAEAKKFLVFVDKTFAPLNCSALYK
jgi:hypothetical protein